MASRRLIAALTVRDGGLVKSYGYSYVRPAGDLRSALRNLDRWAADEILVLDISRRPGLDPVVLEAIERAEISTPLAYGGGIRTSHDLRRLMELGCDRFVVESLLLSDAPAVGHLADLAGRQALIGSLPVRRGPDGDWLPAFAPAIDRKARPLPRSLHAALELLRNSPTSEYLVIAADAEGRSGTFPPPLVSACESLPEQSVIWFGGLDAASAATCLRSPVTAAVALGNPFLEKELALPKLREAMLLSDSATPLRRVRTLRR
jgi:imidazole glycerol-phosphate synthase subunit HisF